ncbi:MAG: uroporphyrinogen decarboxylase family protein [Anaerolineae bacterium]
MSPTPRERVITQIRHQETDYIPYTLGWEGDVAEQLDAYLGSSAWRNKLDNAIHGVQGASLAVDTDVQPLFTDPFGSTWRTDRRPFHLEQPALREPSLEGYVFPDLDTAFPAPWPQPALEALETWRNHFTVIGMSFGLFERTWTLRGFSEALMDAAGDPGFYDELVERVAEHQLAVIDRLLELPVDGIMFSDDWGYQQGVLLGTERWRRFIKPRLACMYARVHAAHKFTLSHCCGSIADIMPDLIEIGLDVIESVQPEARDMNPYALKRQYGDRITFWGGLGSQSTIPFGTPAEIKAEVARLCREMGRGGGYILAPSKGLQPGTAIENAAAVVEAFLAQAGESL